LSGAHWPITAHGANAPQRKVRGKIADSVFYETSSNL
jgi:hypothetical protein